MNCPVKCEWWEYSAECNNYRVNVRKALIMYYEKLQECTERNDPYIPVTVHVLARRSRNQHHKRCYKTINFIHCNGVPRAENVRIPIPLRVLAQVRQIFPSLGSNYIGFKNALLYVQHINSIK